MRNLKFTVLILLTIFGHFSNFLQAQTPGTLTFSVTTTEPSGGYNNVNVIALWIEDTNGVFVKTKIRYAATRMQYLDHWISSSSYNVEDALTGSTRSSHGTLTFTWNGTNVAGDIVADKDYKVWIQMSDANTSGATTSIIFTKDTNSQHITPANSGNFTNMVIDWNPTIGINENQTAKLLFTCFPNPANDRALISYSLEKFSDVTITVHDITGKTVAVLLNENQNVGGHSLYWNINNYPRVTSGIYYISINTGNATASRKIVITK